jgi:hypothetical protein
MSLNGLVLEPEAVKAGTQDIIKDPLQQGFMASCNNLTLHKSKILDKITFHTSTSIGLSTRS